MSNTTNPNNNNHSRWWSRLVLAALLCLALVAAACGGDDPDPTADNGDTSSTTEVSVPDISLGATSTTEVAVAEKACPVHEDPRGGIFQAYQNEFDRCHPFGSLDAFCMPHDAPTETLQATDDGITEDTITLAHIRSKLEQLAAFGFAADLGDPARMFDTFAWYVNEKCGGVNGRKIDLKLIETPAFGDNINELRNIACSEATEDHDAVVVMNSTGFQGTANLCIVEEHKTAFISTQGQSADYVNRGEGRLISMSPTLEESLRFLVATLLESGALEDKTIGVVYPDTPGQPEAVKRGLIDPLKAANMNIAVEDVIRCGGETSCTTGNTDAALNMMDEGVDVIFPTLNVVSLPPFIEALVAEGFQPGDVQFYNSDFNSQASNIVVSRIAAANAKAGELYNGAIIIDDSDPAAFHEPDWKPREFNKMCAKVYDDHHGEVEGNDELTEPPHDPSDPNGNSPHGMIVTICSQMRLVLRAIYDAGANPTREDIYEAITNLGAIDFNNMIPNSIEPGKPQTSDVVHAMMYTYPCATGPEFAVKPPGATEGSCIVNVDDDEWKTVTRS